MPWNLKDHKKDEFILLKHGSITIAAYEAKFHALYRNVTQLVTLEEERIRSFKGLNAELQVLSVYMIVTSKPRCWPRGLRVQVIFRFLTLEV